MEEYKAIDYYSVVSYLSFSPLSLDTPATDSWLELDLRLLHALVNFTQTEAQAKKHTCNV